MDLEEHFYLIGLKSNPYPYLKQADIYVQPSRFEGKSIALDEAKILNKPIVVTNYSTAKDQINRWNEWNNCRDEFRCLAEGIEKLINDTEIYEITLVENLSK